MIHSGDGVSFSIVLDQDIKELVPLPHVSSCHHVIKIYKVLLFTGTLCRLKALSGLLLLCTPNLTSKSMSSMHAQDFQFPSELHGIHTFLKAMEGRQSWKNTYYTEKWALTCCLPIACRDQETAELGTLQFLFL